jgi:hypothetical protein
MSREIELPNNFRNVNNCSSYLDDLNNKYVSRDWFDYINNMNKNEIIKLIKFGIKSGIKIGLKELQSAAKSEIVEDNEFYCVSIDDMRKYIIDTITPAFLKKAIDANIVNFCENWYRGKYVDVNSGETEYIYFEGQADIYALHHTTYTCGLPPPPGWRPFVVPPAGWFMYNNTDPTPLEENMKIIDVIRGKLQNKSPDNQQVTGVHSVVTPVEGVHGSRQVVTPVEGVHGSRQVVTPVEGVHGSRQVVTPVEGVHGSRQVVTSVEGVHGSRQVVTPVEGVHGSRHVSQIDSRGGNKCKKRKYTNKRKFKKSKRI